MKKTEQLVQFLGRLDSGENPAELNKEYRETLALAEPADFAYAEQHLLESGMTACNLCRLCEKITALLGDQVAILQGRLAIRHPMQRIFFQHKRYLRILGDMEDIEKSIAKLHPAWVGCPEYQRLRNLAADVDWIERHTLAEQNVLLPQIDQRGGREITQAIRFQHLDLASCYNKLRTLIGNLNNLDFDDLRQQFNSIVQWLAAVGRMHITVEENVFYPIAAGLIEDKATWDRFFAICSQPKQAAAV